MHFKRVMEQGNYVVPRCFEQWPGDRGWARIDIFRLDGNSKMVEHSDVLQIIRKRPETLANGTSCRARTSFRAEPSP